MMRTDLLSRRELLRRAACGAAAGLVLGGRSGAQEGGRPRAAEHTLTVISGRPRERGRQYGRTFREPIRSFLNREIYEAFTGRPSPRDAMLRYANQCAGAIRDYSPTIMDELEGMAEGSGLRLEEVVLITLHEELWHRGVLPAAEHCTAVAVGPREGATGDTHVGQTWDWMGSVYGLSQVLHWRRPEGPSLLTYAYPGLWVGAGLNSAGLSLCWTSAGSGRGPRVGIPSYVLIAQMLYQDSLRSAIAEARRAHNAGWFTFVLADGEGRLADGVVVEESRGRMVRHNYGSQRRTGNPAGRPANDRCRVVNEVLDRRPQDDGRAALRAVFADRRVGAAALDVMIFNTTRREAHLTRGPGDANRWRTFRFDDR